MAGIFYCGDNLQLLSELNLVPAESVDLIYLDAPFNSARTYNITYKDSQAQTEAFKDHWSWGEAAPLYASLLDASATPPRLSLGSADKSSDDGALRMFIEETRNRLRTLEAESTRDERIEHLLLDHQFWRLQRNYEFEWLRAPMDERRRMLEFAAAGAVNVDMTLGELARVERVLREADPTDMRLLYTLENQRAPLPDPEKPRFGPDDQEARWLNVARIEIAAKAPVQRSALEAAGCLRVVEHVAGPFQSGEGVTVSALGRLVLKVLHAYLQP